VNQSTLNSIKRHLFFEFMNAVGRVFVLVKHSEDVVLGKRGFTAEEREKGIILVFNARMNAMWDEYGITATLVFGSAPQKCFIPADNVVAVYSPEMNAQFIVTPRSTGARQHEGVLSSDAPAEQPGRQANPLPADYGASPRKSVSGKGRGGPKPRERADLTGRAGNVIKVDFSKKLREKGKT
jgi:hypothetical protein